MGALIVIAILLGVGGFIGLALSNEGRTAFPSFLTICAGILLATIAGAGRLMGML
ncbi:hypothetical protein [Bradyrhizobium retamae]|uniref:hypothetical protein n=1 Tax=Bradyrhizobium retamae TaxID=1300035 RepID=UPI000B00C991|nr:hypothetical protein [Bradyrhizobium retamae]